MAPQERSEGQSIEDVRRRSFERKPPTDRSPTSITGFHLDYCQQMTKEYSNVSIQNWGSSWTDGLAFCALTHHFSPDSFDFHKLDPTKRRQNYELAFTAARKLGVEPLLDVDELMESPSIDPRSCFTYVQQFYNVFKHWDDSKSDKDNRMWCLFLKNTRHLCIQGNYSRE